MYYKNSYFFSNLKQLMEKERYQTFEKEHFKLWMESIEYFIAKTQNFKGLACPCEMNKIKAGENECLEQEFLQNDFENSKQVYEYFDEYCSDACNCCIRTDYFGAISRFLLQLELESSKKIFLRIILDELTKIYETL